MTRFSPKCILLLCLGALLLAASTLLAQTPSSRALPTDHPVAGWPGRLEGEPSGTGDSEDVWREDADRVREGIRGQIAPERYMDALKKLGLLDHLRDRALHPADKAAGWQRVGPVGGFGSPQRNGRIAGIQILEDPAVNYRVYVGSCQGGLWRSANIGFGQWTDIGANLPNPSVRAFDVDPDDFDHIIVGTGDHSRYTGGGMFETFDGGVTWDPVTLPFGASTPYYFYRILSLGDDPVSGVRRLAAASSMGPIFSDDDGASWQRGRDVGNIQISAHFTDMLVQEGEPGRLYGVCGVGSLWSGVYTSQDYGETWARLGAADLPPTGDWGRGSLAISRSAPQTLVLVLESGNYLKGVYRSVNGGTSWTDITNELVTADYSFGGNQLFHAQAVAIHPTSPGTIYVGGVGLAVSTDGGASWAIGESENGIGIGHPDFTQILFSPVAGDHVMWLCNDGGIYFHLFISGLTYDGLGDDVTGLSCSEIDFMDAERRTVAIGMQDNGTLLSTDSGVTWEFVEGADGADVEIFDPVAGGLFYNNGVWSPPPSWRTWKYYPGGPKESFGSISTYMPRLYYSPFADRLYTHDSRVLYSSASDDGNIWQVEHHDWKPAPSRVRAIAGDWGREEAAWVTYWTDSSTTNDGDEDLTYIYDDGSAWTEKHWPDFNPSGDPVITVMPSREWPHEAWVGLEGDDGDPKIYHLLNGGDTRIDITGNLDTVNQVRAIAVMPFDTDVIWVGTDLGVFRTTDGGANWSPFMDGLPIARCSDLLFVVNPDHGGTHTLYLSLDGRGVYKRDISMPPVYYVDSSVSASGDGTVWGGALKTVAEAVAVAPAGSIIAVRSGSYVEPQTIGKNLRVVSWQGGAWIH